MRIWHYALLPYLPDMQFRGQLRELVVIMRDWRDKGQTNHLLINKVMEYPKQDLGGYYLIYREEYQRRYRKDVMPSTNLDFIDFCEGYSNRPPFNGWHNKEYLRVCMANLYEKHFFGIGKSRITDEEWQRLCEGYKTITGEDYEI